MAGLPEFACWRHRDARDGFEAIFISHLAGGARVEGHTTAIEDGEPFAVDYTIELDADWRTRAVDVRGRSRRGRQSVRLEADGAGAWRVDGAAAPLLDGCLDVDLEASAFTNALPVHRLGLAPGASADVPAAYVRALDLAVERLEQHYTRIDDGAAEQRYDYAAPAFDFRCDLAYDEAGLLLAYPGLAVRADGPPEPES